MPTLQMLELKGSQTISREHNFPRKPIYKLVFKDRHLGQQCGKARANEALCVQQEHQWLLLTAGTNRLKSAVTQPDRKSRRISATLDTLKLKRGSQSFLQQLNFSFPVLLEMKIKDPISSKIQRYFCAYSAKICNPCLR